MTQIESDAALTLKILVEMQDDREAVVPGSGMAYLDGDALTDATHLSASRLNRAIDFLERDGRVEVIRVMGGAPYAFGSVLATTAGHLAHQTAAARDPDVVDELRAYAPSAAHDWAVAHARFLRVVFDEFDHQGDWPPLDPLQRKLVRASEHLNLAEDAQGLYPHRLGFLESPPDQRIVLGPLALGYVPEAREFLGDLVKVIRLAVAKYMSEDEDLTLRRADLTEGLGLSEDDATKVSRVIVRGARFIGGGSGDATEWEREIYSAGLVPYLGVESVDDYLRVEGEFLGEFLKLPGRIGQAALSSLEGLELESATLVEPESRRRIFLVHGHDEGMTQATARFLERVTKPGVTVLSEEADRGRTIIEKFEQHAAEAGYAVVLLTADDEARERGSDADLLPRARQNVILELGFFVGTLGRGRVAMLYEEGVELPSDISGVLYLKIDSEGYWKKRLATEMLEAGVAVDAEAALRL